MPVADLNPHELMFKTAIPELEKRKAYLLLSLYSYPFNITPIGANQ